MDVIIDLDGTLFDCSHRVHLAQAKQWDEFHSLMLEDRPYAEVVWFLNTLPSKVTRIAVTGRNERYRSMTHECLAKHKLKHLIDDILMRPDDDYTPDHELKLKLLQEYYKQPESDFNRTGKREDVADRMRRLIAVALDDRDKVVEAYRNFGLNCWQVRMGSY